jgi:hypothetical protein
MMMTIIIIIIFAITIVHIIIGVIVIAPATKFTRSVYVFTFGAV